MDVVRDGLDGEVLEGECLADGATGRVLVSGGQRRARPVDLSVERVELLLIENVG